MEQEKLQFRDVFNAEAIRELAGNIHRNYQNFDHVGFCASIIPELPSLTLSERSQLITATLRAYLPQDYEEAVSILCHSLPPEIEEDLPAADRFILMPLCRFISSYGIAYPEISVNALYRMTKCFTAEWDIRPFIENYPEVMLKVLGRWTRDKNCHVRRLVSEGTRPRLPWGEQLIMFRNDPKEVIRLLEKLKDDPALYVRRSVANNLNDIAKDHPEVVIRTLMRWKKEGGAHTDWIIRHATRTLIKDGYREAFSLMGFHATDIEVKEFTSLQKKVKIGEDIVLSAVLQHSGKQSCTAVIDYAVHFMRANGKHRPKVFKWITRTLEPGKELHIGKKHSFREISTRNYYPGKHFIEIQVNGCTTGKLEIILCK